MGETKSALIIANYRYEHRDLRQLLAPAQDAESLARVLADRELGGFEVRTLINEPSSKVNLEIEDFCENRKRDDLLLIYFSGHGIKDADGQLYFATVDTQLVQHNVRRATAISARFVNEAMSRSRSRRQILLLDCCYSGAFKQGMLAKGDKRVGASEQLEGQGRIVLTASDALQYSFEGESVEGEGIRSIFTRTLVHGLETGEADLDRDGLFSLDDVYNYVYLRVSDDQPDQKPTMMGYVEGKIYLGTNPRPLAAKLPQELLDTLESPLVWVRVGAVQQLEKLLDSKNRGLILAAHAALTSLATSDDSQQVRTAATKYLAEAESKVREQAGEAQHAREEGEARERAEVERKVREREEEARRKAEVQRAQEEAAARERAEAEHKVREQAEEARRKAEAQRSREEAAARERAEAERTGREHAEEARQWLEVADVREEPEPRRPEAWAVQAKAGLRKWRRGAIVILVVNAVIVAVILGAYYAYLTPVVISIFSALSLVAGPLLCILAVSYIVTRRKPRLFMLAVIALALTSVSIQLGVASVTIVAGFGDIAKQSASGIVSIFAYADRPLLWRFVEAGLCVAVAAAIAPWVWGGVRGKEALESRPGPAAMIAWSVSALVAVAALVWFYHEIVELCMVVVDPCRADPEATRWFSRWSRSAGLGAGLGTITTMLTHRLELLGLSAYIITLCLLGIGFYCLHAERRARWGFAASMIVAVFALVWCSMSAFAEWSALSYLQGPELTASAPHPIYHRLSPFVIGSMLDSKVSETAVPDGPAVQLSATNNSIRLLDADKEDAVIVTVSRDGQSFLGRETVVPKTTMIDAVKDLLANHLNKEVYVRADARARYGAVAQVFSQLRTAGFDFVGLLTSKRNPETGSCLASGLEVLLPAPAVPAASVSARQGQNSEFPPPPPPRPPPPAKVPTGTGARDPIVIQVLRGPGGVQWKINRMEVYSLSELTAELENHFHTLAQRLAYLTADDTLAFSDFVDGVDAATGAGVDKITVILEKIE